MNRTFQLASADLVVPNQEAWGLMWDFDALREIVDALPGTSALQNRALAVANAMMNAFDRGDPASVGAARALAERVFGAGWAAKQERIYEEGSADAQIWGIGHCHIDTAWCAVARAVITTGADRWACSGAGYGRTASLSRRSRARGRPRSTSWTAIPSTASLAALRSNTNGSSR